jgi:flagellar basal-body rod protein FlgF
MSQGFYTAAQAMLIQQRRLNSTSNNLANVNTSGYKREEIIVSNFQQLLSYRLDNSGKHVIGSTSQLQTVDEVMNFFEQANITATENPLDLAIAGDGFFQSGEPGNLVYTRNGSMSIDAQGYLTLSKSGRLRGADGPIYVGNSQFTVLSDGTVLSQEKEILGRIVLYSADDISGLMRTENGSYLDSEGSMQAIEGTIIQGHLERSNVDITTEMTRLIEIQRNFQSVANALKTIDQLNAKTVSEIGRL